MNTLILALELETDALRGDLRPSKRPPRPIPWPKKGVSKTIGDRR
jgi:hypothetical protein